MAPRSVRAALPSNEPGQIVSDERLDSDRLFFTIRTQDGERMAVWSGPISRVHRLRHGFRVQISSVETPLPTGPLAKPPEDVEADWGRPSRGAPSNATEIADLLRLLRVNEDADPRGRLRTVFGFVADEVAEVESESKDALLTLAAREGSAEGKERLLVSLVRGSGKAICGITLTNTDAGNESFQLFVKPRCDPAIANFAPTIWRIERGELLLISAKREIWRFEADDNAQWRRVPDSADPFLLVRQ